MIRQFICSGLFFILCASAHAAEHSSLGAVNFGTCVNDSKLGKEKQASFEALKKQMSSLLEEKEKQLNTLAAKFNDPEQMDSLSPEQEEELKNQFRTLNEEMNQFQNQYYQVLNQKNMQIVQTIAESITAASAKVAAEKKLSAVFNKEALFYMAPAMDITPAVIAEMDTNFETSAKEEASASKTKK